MPYSFAHIQRAWSVQDPQLVGMMMALAHQADAAPKQPIPDDELTFERFLSKIFAASFREQDAEVQFAQRLAMIATLEADQGSAPLPERYKLHVLLRALWEDDSPYARVVLIQAIRELPLVYGVWKAIKHIFKAAEAKHDYAMLAVISAKLDLARAKPQAQGISGATLTYMVLRAWRVLRTLGEQAPIRYADTAILYLAEYAESIQDGRMIVSNTWVLNHLCFHNLPHSYGIDQFKLAGKRKLFDAKGRAFAQLWQRHPAPLLRLIGLARSEAVRQWATDSLIHDFALQLREVSVGSIQQLSQLAIYSSARDELIVWLLKHASFEQHQYAALGLHDVVIALLDSPFADAQRYACGYAKAHGRQIPLSHLLRLADSSSPEVRQLVMELLLSRDPRVDIGLVAWGQLLDSSHHHAMAAEQLRKHFGRSELHAEWFAERLLSGSRFSVDFAKANLLGLHPLKSLPVAYWTDLANTLSAEARHRSAMQFVLEQLHAVGLAQVDTTLWPYLLLHPHAQATVKDWLNRDELKAASLEMAYWHALAYEPDWQQSAMVQAIKQRESQLWATQLSFDADLAEVVRGWLADVRRFAPATLGFDWLMTLAQREEPEYHDFAVERMIKAFVPADFAPSTEPATAASPTGDSHVDLAQQSFLFTGKLSSMTRDQAEAMVTAANGKNSGAVNAKLDFLVIGDDGSPLYGNGRKGSKQVKAESLVAQGAAIKIISETAFLQMLAGQSRAASTDQTVAGCEVLWQMITAQPQSPSSRLAIQYIRHHHAELCLSLTDRPVDPDAVIPKDFLIFERVAPLLAHIYSEIRQFALELARFELKRWQPTTAQLLSLAESKHAEVQQFVHAAIFDEPAAANQAYHLDGSSLEAELVYRLCDSKQRFARQLGMQLISGFAVFQAPDVLFQLTESHDRELRYTVLRILWRLYRHYSTTATWQPSSTPLVTLGKAKIAAQAARAALQGTGLPTRPSAWPATPSQMQALLKRWLFELPPARLAPSDREGKRHQPMSASRAKTALIDTFRDLAIEDADFAQLILPVLQAFCDSRGRMEQAACLVAVTRITQAHPQLTDNHTALILG